MSSQKKQEIIGNNLYDCYVVFKEDDERAVRYFRLEDDIKTLAGRILTVIDASIIDDRQNKAMKDIVKGHIHKFLYQYQEMCYFGHRAGSGPILE